MPSEFQIWAALSSCSMAAQAEVGCRTSAGIACNKMLAKLVSGLHKPNDQTIMPPPFAAAFLGPLPVRAIPGASLTPQSIPQDSNA